MLGLQQQRHWCVEASQQVNAEFADETTFGDKLLMLRIAGVYVTINPMVPELFKEL